MSAFTTTTLVILALAFGQYDCGHLLNINMCHHVARICTRSLYDMARNTDFASFDIDEGCTVMDSLRTCMGGCLESMVKGSGERALVGSLEYLCYPSRREEIRAASRAECFRDRSLVSSLEEKAQICASSAPDDFEGNATNSDMGEGGQVCSMVNHLLDCFTDDLRDMCGEAVVSIYRSMFQVAVREVIGEPCITQHSIVRRAVSTFFEQVRK